MTYPEYDNSSVGEEEHFEVRHIWETLLDWQVWLHILVYMSIIAPRKFTFALVCPRGILTHADTIATLRQCTVSRCSCRKSPFFIRHDSDSTRLRD